MKKGRSKEVGNAFERKIAKKLSLWWTDNDRDDVFWLTSGSGARATTRSKQGKKTKYEYGDLSFTDPIGKSFIDRFLIELKKGYSKKGQIDPLAFIDSKQKQNLLLKFWEKAEAEKELAERKYSLIIFERNNMKACVMISFSFFQILLQLKKTHINYLMISPYFKKDLVIITLDEFLNSLDLKDLYRRIKWK